MFPNVGSWVKYQLTSSRYFRCESEKKMTAARVHRRIGQEASAGFDHVPIKNGQPTTLGGQKGSTNSANNTSIVVLGMLKQTGLGSDRSFVVAKDTLFAEKKPLDS